MMSSVALIICVSMLASLPVIQAAHNILWFGAVPTLEVGSQPDVSIANQNAHAISKAFHVASISADKTILVPEMNFYITSVILSNMTGLTLQIEGSLICHNNISTWPEDQDKSDGSKLNALQFNYFSDFTITSVNGKGLVDGQGYVWWWWSISTAFPNADHEDHRFHMIFFNRGKNILVENVKLMNSPNYHIKMDDGHNLTVRNFEIFVDVFRQKEMLIEADFFDHEHGIPTFPLNTDGIDPSASAVHVYNGKITNFDDAVVFKPCHLSYEYCENGCSGGYVHDLEIVFSVGLSIGSVPPNNDRYCVANATFKDINLYDPLKGIYIKSNPGTTGTGLIENILYENIYIQRALWWPLWIGPQQMSQPDGTYLGCDMLYPFRSLDCPTNPLVTMRGITLRNVTSVQGVNPYPGVMICNVSNPCTDFVFEDVYFQEGKSENKTSDFITSYVVGTTSNSSPEPQWFLL